MWDYHVVAISAEPEAAAVWDLDSTLAFPCGLLHYVHEAVRPGLYGSQHVRLFRVVHAPLFLSNFASDRSHMLKPWARGMSHESAHPAAYQMPPPPYPCIRTERSSNNIAEYWDMSRGRDYRQFQAFHQLPRTELGCVIDEMQLLSLAVSCSREASA